MDKVDSFQQDGHTYHKVDRSLLPDTYMNEYIYDDSKDFAARTVKVDETTVTLMDLGYDRLMQQSCWGIQPDQSAAGVFAMQSLMDPEVDLSILLGAAGSGKTLIALACALEMVIEEQRFNKIIVTRSTPPVAEDIGFLPRNRRGENDALDELDQRYTLKPCMSRTSVPQSSVKYAIEKANIQFKSLNFIRGRSIQNAIVLIDEAQNLTPQQLKNHSDPLWQGYQDGMAWATWRRSIPITSQR